jgi:nitrogen regulatory protein PII-like uncharacterized protein
MKIEKKEKIIRLLTDFGTEVLFLSEIEDPEKAEKIEEKLKRTYATKILKATQN